MTTLLCCYLTGFIVFITLLWLIDEPISWGRVLEAILWPAALVFGVIRRIRFIV